MTDKLDNEPLVVERPKPTFNIGKALFWFIAIMFLMAFIYGCSRVAHFANDLNGMH